LEDFINPGQGFGRFYKNLQVSRRILIGFNDYLEGLQWPERFSKNSQAWASPKPLIFIGFFEFRWILIDPFNRTHKIFTRLEICTKNILLGFG